MASSIADPYIAAIWANICSAIAITFAGRDGS
jgi:hypothetical protein